MGSYNPPPIANPLGPCRPADADRQIRYHWIYNPTERRIVVAEWGYKPGTVRSGQGWKLGYGAYTASWMGDRGWIYGEPADNPPARFVEALGFKISAADNEDTDHGQ